MKIDWKAVAQSPGYKSLKASYMRDVGPKSKAGRSKKELYQRFQWTIGRAQHYAVRLGKSLEDILNEWETKRNSWWFGHYTDQHFPKLPSGKPRNVKHMKPETYWLRGDPWGRARTAEWFHRLRVRRADEARFNRKHRHGKKPRWSAERKAREAKYRKYRQQSL